MSPDLYMAAFSAVDKLRLLVLKEGPAQVQSSFLFEMESYLLQAAKSF